MFVRSALLACLLTAPLFAVGRSNLFKLVQQNPDRPSQADEDVKVPIQLGVASKDGSAILCHRIFDQVRERVQDKMQINLVYVATLNDTEPDFGVTCANGPEECAGDIQQLCVKKHQPESWWKFIHCQNYQGRGKIGSPDVAFQCARLHNIDWELSGVGQCAGPDASGRAEEGVRLLQDSVRLADRLEIDTSCTILINEREVCIHDGSWKRCEDGHSANDFVKQINSEYDRLNS